MRPIKTYIIHYADENGYMYSEIIATVRNLKTKLRRQGYKFENSNLSNLEDASIRLRSCLSSVYCEIEELAEGAEPSVYLHGKEYLPLYKWGKIRRYTKRELDTLVAQKRLKPTYINHIPYIERDYAI